MKAIMKILLTAVAVMILAHVLPGIGVNNYTTAIVVALTISLLNSLVRPILVFFTLPASIVTFGLFLFVINACVILLAENIVGDFKVTGFWYALLFSVCLSLLRSLFFKFLEGDNEKKIER